MQCTNNLSVQSNSMQHLSVKAMQCSTCQCNCNAIQCNPIHYNTKLHCTPLPCTALLYVAQSCFLPDLTRSSNLIRSPNFTRSPNLMLSRTLDGRFWDRGKPFLSFYLVDFDQHLATFQRHPIGRFNKSMQVSTSADYIWKMSDDFHRRPHLIHLPIIVNLKSPHCQQQPWPYVGSSVNSSWRVHHPTMVASYQVFFYTGPPLKS